MADDQNAAEATQQKRGSGWVLALWLMAPIVVLLLLTLLSYRK